jgi:unspecific monooxygenase
VQRTTDTLLDDVQGAGEFDLLSTVAEPLPVTVIAEMLGVPEADRHLLRPWSADICGMYELDPDEQTAARAVRACEEFSDYLVALSRERREHPRDDLVTALTQVVDDGDVLTEDELVGTCVLLLNAGHEATVNVTGNGWWSLFRNPDQLSRLRADHSLLPTAVEELMRWDTPLQMFERWVLEDLEIGGVPVPRGAELGLLFGSANRDPAVFPEPDALDVGRDPNPHVSFGAACTSASAPRLARLELQTSFGTVLRRLPGLQLVEEPTWKPGYVIRGLHELRVQA